MLAQVGGLAVMGDSLSDEYSDQPWGGYATNWVQLVEAYRGIDLGPTATEAGQEGGTWGEPRRTGFAYDWARSGDDSGDLLSHGQHTGVASQVDSNEVTHAVLVIGSNDFNPSVLGGPYWSIYYNSWSDTQKSNYVNQILGNIETALVAVRDAGGRVVLGNVLDFGLTPAVYNNFLFRNDTNRDRVSAVIQQVNAGLVDLAQRYQVPLIDLYGLQQDVFGTNTNLRTTLTIGNVAIQLQQGDTDPVSNPNRTAAFVDDEAHPHTTIQGLFANVILEALWLGYDEFIPLFTEQEILANAGLVYGGLDTVAAEIGAYSDYVILPIKPQVVQLVWGEGGFRVTFTTVEGQLYQVDACDDLVAGNWHPLVTDLPGTGGIVTVADPDAEGLDQQFYRVQQLP